MHDKTVMITGANSGLGYATALELARMGARIIMVCRDRAKGESAQAEIKAKSGNDQIDLLLADLSSQAAIRDLATTFKSKYDRLHVLINNAGIAVGVRKLTIDGLEQTFAVNHLAYFLLTNLLLDVLKASTPARIINLSSGAQGFGKIDFDDLMAAKNYNTGRAYGQSKLANVMFTYELARQIVETGITANCIHPGAVRTNFAMDAPGLFGFIARLARPFELSPEQGAQTIIYLASSPDVDGVTGKYFSNKKPIQSSKQSYDEVATKKLWQISAELVKL